MSKSSNAINNLRGFSPADDRGVPLLHGIFERAAREAAEIRRGSLRLARQSYRRCRPLHRHRYLLRAALPAIDAGDVLRLRAFRLAEHRTQRRGRLLGQPRRAAWCAVRRRHARLDAAHLLRGLPAYDRRSELHELYPSVACAAVLAVGPDVVFVVSARTRRRRAGDLPDAAGQGGCSFIGQALSGARR
jgi:hypothetical protein